MHLLFITVAVIRGVSNPESYREQATAVFSDGTDSPERQIRNGLKIGTDYLDVSIGFLTQIRGETQEIVYSTGSHPLLQPGKQCPLEDAYCQRTVETEGTLSVQAATASDIIPDQAVEMFDLETYVGAKITVNGDLYGTICFADTEARSDPFTETEELFVELLAERIGITLGQQAHEAELARENERLQAEKRRFEGIATASADIIFRIDEEMEFTYVSPAVERLLGYEPEALLGEPFLTVLADDSTETALDLYQRVLSGDAADAVELDLESADGTVRTFEINARPFGEPTGDDTGIQGTARDVTERKERDRELTIKNRAMDEAEVGIIIADGTRENNPITYVNEEFCTLTGYERDAVLGANCRFLQGEATDPETVTRLREAIAAGEPVSVDIVNYRASGRAFWNAVSVTPVETEAGEVTQYIGFQQDITDRKRRQQLLDVMNRVLRHNLRNELTIILGANEAGDQPAVVRAAAERLLSLADRARDVYSHTQRDREPKRISPETLFGDLSEAFGNDHPDATLELTIDTDRDMVAGEELRDAVSELVENALVHDPASDTAVEVSARDDGDEVVLTVTDDGPGIDAMEKAVVEAGQESPLKHGSGLGLWFVNWVVTRYGGSFQVAARDGPDVTGTVATVRIPAVGPEQDVDAAARRLTILAG
ncbi:PAS domain S-box protein [Halorubrum sp. SD626R]|uniref:PAS domain S-box protein n=1 Tax=Halorubrum sp. SD626R TaxID=1419722 RepID=UPI000B142FC5|nr:PAS domain S-box protein [Halorubrum sp. SD626R]TKX80975.1 PAS domain S-box protein [Halorubrum sp. SD626R]